MALKRRQSLLEQLTYLDNLHPLFPVLPSDHQYSYAHFGYLHTEDRIIRLRQQLERDVSPAVLLTFIVGRDIEHHDKLVTLDVLLAVLYYNGNKVGVQLPEVLEVFASAYGDRIWNIEGHEVGPRQYMNMHHNIILRMVGRLWLMEVDFRDLSGIRNPAAHICMWEQFYAYMTAGLPALPYLIA